MSDPVARLSAALEGRYAIERELGEGGMATVYLADDITLSGARIHGCTSGDWARREVRTQDPRPPQSWLTVKSASSSSD